VNGWLKEISGTDTSAKMFRTWHGSVEALNAVLNDVQPSIKRACEAAADILCNTPAIARKSYVHPAIFEMITDPATLAAFRKLPSKRRSGLTAAENRLLQLIG
jgi:DNA topoisomerase-1